MLIKIRIDLNCICCLSMRNKSRTYVIWSQRQAGMGFPRRAMKMQTATSSYYLNMYSANLSYNPHIFMIALVIPIFSNGCASFIACVPLLIAV